MSSSSVSFRITRNTEDLASTLHTLSQRLVRLEQRLAALEVQLANQDKADPQELVSLENVERLLGDCRDLLALDFSSAGGPAPQEQEVVPQGTPQADDDVEHESLREPVAGALVEDLEGSEAADLLEELAS